MSIGSVQTRPSAPGTGRRPSPSVARATARRHSAPAPLAPPPSGRALRCALGLLLFIPLLPLQWQNLGASPIGVIRFHLIGALLMIVVAWPPASAYRQILRRLRPLPLAFVTLTIVWVVTAVAWGGQPVNYVQTFLYSVFGLVAAAALLTAFQTERARRLLAWCGPATVATFIVFYYASARQAGVDPVAELLRGLQSGDAVRMQVRLFTAVFRGADEAARGNMRHEVMAALVVAGAISIAAASLTKRSARFMNLAMLAIVAISLVSLSRSILLALAIVLIPIVIRIVSNGDLSPARFYGLFVAAFAVPAALAVAATLLLSRLEDTRSYDARLFAFDLSSGDLITRMLAGGATLTDSTHTLVFDALLEASLLGFLAAVVLVGVLCAMVVRAWSAYLATGSTLMIAVVLALSVPLVRAFTAGGGQIAGPGWLAMGFAGAALVYAESQQRGTPDDPAPSDDADPVEPDTDVGRSRSTVGRAAPRRSRPHPSRSTRRRYDRGVSPRG